MASKTYLSEKRATRLKWSRNANAAKERKRMENPIEREPRLRCLWLSGFEITVRCKADGECVTFEPESVRDCFRKLRVIFRHYRSASQFNF